MNSFESKNLYIDLMRDSLAATAAGDLDKALLILEQIEQLGHDTIQAAVNCNHPNEKQMLIEVVYDSISFLSRSAAQSGQAGPNEFSQAIRSMASRVIDERDKSIPSDALREYESLLRGDSFWG